MKRIGTHLRLTVDLEKPLMSAQHHFAPGDHRDRDLYARERVLNSAIIAADIGRGWEEYLEIFNAFYADEVEVTTDTGTGPIRGHLDFVRVECVENLQIFFRSEHP